MMVSVTPAEETTEVPVEVIVIALELEVAVTLAGVETENVETEMGVVKVLEAVVELD